MKWLQLIPQIILLSVMAAGAAQGATCFAPRRPFVPNDSATASEYADLIRADFEYYIRDVQEYFQCLDREVSQEYGAFLDGALLD